MGKQQRSRNASKITIATSGSGISMLQANQEIVERELRQAHEARTEDERLEYEENERIVLAYKEKHETQRAEQRETARIEQEVENDQMIGLRELYGRARRAHSLEFNKGRALATLPELRFVSSTFMSFSGKNENDEELCGHIYPTWKNTEGERVVKNGTANYHGKCKVCQRLKWEEQDFKNSSLFLVYGFTLYNDHTFQPPNGKRALPVPSKQQYETDIYPRFICWLNRPYSDFKPWAKLQQSF